MKLYTPGPLTTSSTVKRAMLQDIGAWDSELINLTRLIQSDLLNLAQVSEEEYACIFMQGSGTFGVESTIGSLTPPDGKCLIAANGAYGERIIRIAQMLKLNHVVLRIPEHIAISAQDIDQLLDKHKDITSVILVHCETTTGLLNPVREIGNIVHQKKRHFIVDAMSSFGGIPVEMDAWHIDALISSANKCIQGVPGFSFVIARRDLLINANNWARSLSLDLVDQWRGFETHGRFRFTPPTHVLLAFQQALKELEQEGGIVSRANRYQANHNVLLQGMHNLGFKALIDSSIQSYIITAFLYPNSLFNFNEFYSRLKQQGHIIYPGKISYADTFRIGTIGDIRPCDISLLVKNINSCLNCSVSIKKSKTLNI